MIKPFLMLIGLILGAILGAYISGNDGLNIAGYVSNLLGSESPDEAGNLYLIGFFGTALVVGLIGLLFGWLIGGLLTRKKS